MPNKKSLSKEKKLRRELEILKAQLKTQPLSALTSGTLAVPEKTIKEDKYKLPIQRIKRDLFKTTFFALVSFTGLIVLKMFAFN